VSLRLRVALFTAIAVALVELAIVASVYAFVSFRLYSQVEQDLRDIASVIVPVVTTTGDLPIRPAQDLERPPFIPRLVDANGQIVSARASLDLPVSDRVRAVASGAAGSSLETVAFRNTHFYILTVPAGDGRALQIVHSLADVEEVLRQLLVAAIAFAAAGVVAAPLAGAAVATGALVPLRRSSEVAERVRRTGDLTQRVNARGRDELASFARSFDAMLDELESMVAEVERARRMQRQLVADASHELRAPLAALRANVEVLSLGTDAVADRSALIADTLAGIADLTTLVGQLIDLAREDQRVQERAPVRLDRVVADEADRIGRSYPAVDLVTSLEPTSVLGDVEALTHAVANLLDNAAKWTPAGGTVQVELRDGTLEVRDQGPGIDAADLPRIFERFYRGSRSGGVPGSGLGLAIVAQVMSSHGGTVSARSGDGGGAIFTAHFTRAGS
jgi:two-component system sensor histidine kinase MprB